MTTSSLSLNKNYFKEFEEVVIIDRDIDSLLVAEKILSKSGKPFFLFLLDKNSLFDSRLIPEVISLDKIEHVKDYFWNTRIKSLFLYGPSINKASDC